MKILRIPLLLLTGLLLAASGWAQEAETDRAAEGETGTSAETTPGDRADGPPRWSVGGGFVVSPNPYEDADTEIQPIPVVIYRGERFYFRTIEAGWRILRPLRRDGTERGNELALFGRWRFDGYEDEGGVLEGLERDGTLEAGLRWARLGSWGTVTLEALADAAGEHEGQIVNLAYSRTWKSRKWQLEPSVGVVWKSEDFVDYYYGVRPGEARPGRPVYRGDDAVNALAGLFFTYNFNRRWSLLGILELELLDGVIEDSPLVDTSSEASGVFGLVYNF